MAATTEPARANDAAAREPRDAREMLERGRAFLEKKGIESARLEAELLIAHALGLDRLQLFLALDRPLQATEIARGRELLVRRARGEPTAYVIGKREFYGRDFRVGPGVLVPRPDSELLVDRARELLAEKRAARILDVGTGSGCLALTLALELEGSEVCAVDCSARALEYARVNAEQLGVRLDLRLGDGFAPLAGLAPFDLVVSNPPYIDPATRAALAPEVREHEPAEALFAPPGEPDHWVRRLLAESPAWLAPGGWLLVELGFDQGARAASWFGGDARPWRLWRDLAKHERVLEVPSCMTGASSSKSEGQ